MVVLEPSCASVFRDELRNLFPDDPLIVADGFSCQEQIAQLTGRRAIHLAQALRLGLDGNRPT